MNIFICIQYKFQEALSIIHFFYSYTVPVITFSTRHNGEIRRILCIFNVRFDSVESLQKRKTSVCQNLKCVIKRQFLSDERAAKLNQVILIYCTFHIFPEIIIRLKQNLIKEQTSLNENDILFNNINSFGKKMALNEYNLYN